MTFIRPAKVWVSGAAGRLVKISRVTLNGLLAIYNNKFSRRNTSYGNKYSQQGTTYNNKYHHL